MRNLSDGIIVHQCGATLDRSIREAFKITSDALLKAYNFEQLDLLGQVTAKSNVAGAFSKFAIFNLIPYSGLYDALFLEDVYRALQNPLQPLTAETVQLYSSLVKTDWNKDVQMRRSFITYLRSGFGIFLIALHCMKAITLPNKFLWPTSRVLDSGTSRASRYVCQSSELLAFVRSIAINVNEQRDPAFAAVERSEKRVTWYLTNATRVVLTLGWHKPEDVNLEDLLALREFDLIDGVNKTVSVQETFLDSLIRKFGDRCKVSPLDWQIALSALEQKRGRNFHSVQEKNNLEFSVSSETEAGFASQVASLLPSQGRPGRIENLSAIPGSNFDIGLCSKHWIKLQKIYLKQLKRESSKQSLLSIGLLNLYLFVYLPGWFARNPGVNISYPSTPNLLKRVLFVSRLQDDKKELPITLMNFLTKRSEKLNHANTTLYAVIMQIEQFFDFLKLKSDELEGCDAFEQPICHLDYPKVNRPGQTTKEVFPIRIFPIFLRYVEAIKDYHDKIIDAVMRGSISDQELSEALKLGLNCVDTRSSFFVENFGPSPIVKFGDRSIEIQYLPYFPERTYVKLRDLGIVKVPRPHVLNQIIVALYTGLRHNHIQWLDVDTFDQHVTDDHDFAAKLYVNTDKVKKCAWVADVNMSVIKILRQQKAWREQIEDKGFHKKCFYNNEPKTRYAPIKALFAANVLTGAPHPDSAYDRGWSDMLIGFQIWINELVSEIGGKPYSFASLMPVGIKPNDPKREEKLKKLAKSTKGKCELKVSSEITPHSSRANVVKNHAMTMLTPELIGERFTGQAPGTVAYYCRPHPDDLKDMQIRQALEMQNLALNNEISNFFESKEHSADIGKAALLNSNIAKSMLVNTEQTLARYGCISTFAGEGIISGIDLIRERGISRLAFNDTEICPYNNKCPDYIVEHIGGRRRCSLCPAAVRSIDHLPAVSAAVKYTFELLYDFDRIITSLEQSGKYLSEVINDKETERQRVAEDLAGWQLCENILERTRAKFSAREDSIEWIVEEPEILMAELQRVEVKNEDVKFLIARLMECDSYPGFKSEKVEREFDLLRRKALAAIGDFDKAFDMRMPINAAAECTGLFRSLVQARKISIAEIVDILNGLNRSCVAISPKEHLSTRVESRVELEYESI